jgi:hypothetical protein
MLKHQPEAAIPNTHTVPFHPLPSVLPIIHAEAAAGGSQPNTHSVSDMSTGYAQEKDEGLLDLKPVRQDP